MKKILTTARVTGLFYLGLALTGMLAFLFARSELYVAGDALTTATRFQAQESLARVGLAAELALVAFQALVAVWFFKLFRKTDLFSAVALTSFGIVNALLILTAAAFWLSSLHIVLEAPVLDAASAREALQVFEVHESLWVVGKLFFGLWLIPMGVLARAARLPGALGWLLIAGGTGYVASLFLQVLFPGIAPSLLELITVPATIGEFWMIGYLLFKRVRTA